MTRAILFFAVSAVASFFTLLAKSEHSFDVYLLVPVGLYFIAAMLLTFRPTVDAKGYLAFTGAALLIWLVLFAVTYNALFVVILPIAGGLGAWLMTRLGKAFLALPFGDPRYVIVTGIGATLAGLIFMMAVRSMPKDVFTLGVKTGVIVALWQLGVGWQLYKNLQVKEKVVS
jgi:tellurite resistance protein TehA-like permease